jgi:hypothetical protein
MIERELSEFLEECRRFARACLDRGDTAGAIAAMLAFLQVVGAVDREGCERLTEDFIAESGGDVEEVRRFVESWRIEDLH